jgi:transcriptional regulator with XRE-family HTH domain
MAVAGKPRVFECERRRGRGNCHGAVSGLPNAALPFHRALENARLVWAYVVEMTGATVMQPVSTRGDDGLPEPANNNFAARLMVLRAERRLSRERLAKLMGVTKVTIWQWEKGDSRPRAGNLLALARVLDVSSQYLERGQSEKGTIANGRSTTTLSAARRLTPQDLPRTQVLSDVMDEAKRIIASATGIDPTRITVQIDY